MSALFKNDATNIIFSCAKGGLWVSALLKNDAANMIFSCVNFYTLKIMLRTLCLKMMRKVIFVKTALFQNGAANIIFSCESAFGGLEEGSWRAVQILSISYCQNDDF